MLFGLFVRLVLFTPLAELGEFKAGLEFLFVLITVVIDVLALRAFHFDQVVLGHIPFLLNLCSAIA